MSVRLTATLTARVPVIPDDQLTAHKLIVAEFSAFKRCFGQWYRVDTSTEAGTRWDTNVVGFRGEVEFGFDARPGVYAGAAQYIAAAGS